MLANDAGVAAGATATGVSCGWTSEERLRVIGVLARNAVEAVQTGQLASDGMLHALETIHQLQALPAAYLETHRERILALCGQEGTSG